jgi:DNA-binding transcriptional LysR family regulator
MSAMNWGAFDLNLLVVFDAVMQERSVTRAGRRLALSQSAVSHALSRLRHVLKDELFVRSPDGMVPTPRAAQLAEPLSRALGEMRLALELERFAPAGSDRRFDIAVNNYAAIALAPAVVAAVARAAPRLRLDLRPSGTLDLLERLDRGELDLAIADGIDPGKRFVRRTLIEDSFVVVMRRDHPAGRPAPTADDFARLEHLAITSSGEDISFVDDWFAARGGQRRIAHGAPYLAALRILAGSDLVAIFSGRIATQFLREGSLQAHPLPFSAPTLRADMLWHRRLENQPAHRWLRETIAAACAGL